MQPPAARGTHGRSCSEALLGPTQRILGRPGGEHENGRPTRKWQLRTIARAPTEPASTHTHTHTHIHLRIHNLKKGVSENEAPGPIGAYTTNHNHSPTPIQNRCRSSFTESHSPNRIHRAEIRISHSPNLIHRIAFTELKFEYLSRGAEGVSAGGATLKHSRTHAPTGPRETRTYMHI